MKIKILIFLVISFLNINSSFAGEYNISFKTELTCDLFHNDKKFTTKTWPLDTSIKNGYLNYVDNTIIEWHESIPVNEEPLIWIAMFYHVNRYTGEGHWDSTREIKNEVYLSSFLTKDLIRRSAHLYLKEYLDLEGTIRCRETDKKF
tara:strand:+ start:1021 stop:1461 length:441 start_codon:yes stop_codon:yes gene_type:complete